MRYCFEDLEARPHRAYAALGKNVEFKALTRATDLPAEDIDYTRRGFIGWLLSIALRAASHSVPF